MKAFKESDNDGDKKLRREEYYVFMDKKYQNQIERYGGGVYPTKMIKSMEYKLCNGITGGEGVSLKDAITAFDLFSMTVMALMIETPSATAAPKKTDASTVEESVAKKEKLGEKEKDERKGNYKPGSVVFTSKPKDLNAKEQV